MNTEQPVSRRSALSSLWLVYLLNFIFRDIHEFAKAETLEQLMAGSYNGIEPTQVLFLIGGIIVSIPISMVFFSHVLPRRANRWANIIVAILLIASIVTTAHTDLDDYYHAGVEAAALLGVIWLAWRWQPSSHQNES
jgi:Na+/glutamate symporter